MSTMEEFAKRCTEMADRKSGTSVHFEKAYNTTVTAPQIADVDRTIAPQDDRTAAASFFTNTTISGNAITYFKQGAFETNGGISPTAQGNKKPQASTSFNATTLALSKLAAYIKETERSSKMLRSCPLRIQVDKRVCSEPRKPGTEQQNMTESQ